MTGERLTARQEEVLRLSAMMTDKEIGRALGISENTVDKHFREILRKCGVHNRKAALRQLAPETSYATAAVPPAPPAMPDPGIGEAPSLPPPFPVPPSRLPPSISRPGGGGPRVRSGSAPSPYCFGW